MKLPALVEPRTPNQSLNAFTGSLNIGSLAVGNEITLYESTADPQNINIEDFISPDGEVDIDALMEIGTGDQTILDLLTDYYYETSEEIVNLDTEISQLTKQKYVLEEEEKTTNIEKLQREVDLMGIEKEVLGLSQHTYLKKAIATTIENVDKLQIEINELGTEPLMDLTYPLTNHIIHNLLPPLAKYGSLEDLVTGYEDQYQIVKGECGKEYCIDDMGVNFNRKRYIRNQKIADGEIIEGVLLDQEIPGFMEQRRLMQNDEYMKRTYDFVLVEAVVDHIDNSRHTETESEDVGKEADLDNGSEDQGDKVDQDIENGHEDQGDHVDKDIENGPEDQGDHVDKDIENGSEDQGDHVDQDIKNGSEDQGDHVDQDFENGSEDQGDYVDQDFDNGSEDQGDHVDQDFENGSEVQRDYVDQDIENESEDQGDHIDQDIENGSEDQGDHVDKEFENGSGDHASIIKCY